MENKAHAFLAGLFTIGLIIFIGLAVMWFNRDQTVRLPYDRQRAESAGFREIPRPGRRQGGQHPL